jgi:hypothetical protein
MVVLVDDHDPPVGEDKLELDVVKAKSMEATEMPKPPWSITLLPAGLAANGTS